MGPKCSLPTPSDNDTPECYRCKMMTLVLQTVTWNGVNWGFLGTNQLPGILERGWSSKHSFDKTCPPLTDSWTLTALLATPMAILKYTGLNLKRNFKYIFPSSMHRQNGGGSYLVCQKILRLQQFLPDIPDIQGNKVWVLSKVHST